ncbi:MAG TPA: glycerophosphodiester phosphodiesterase family protein, partial [Acidimicrobiales bacterium]|nr:glycerophosphodiester phosphodiesterase family protein [Acidimicrobiales bacterium]
IVTTTFVQAAHDHGLAVHVWTIDDEPEMERLLDLGVDGIMTDRPTALESVLQRRGVTFSR